MGVPLLSTQPRTTPGINTRSLNSDINESRYFDQSRNSEDHPSSAHVRLDESGYEDEQATGLKYRDGNRFKRVPKHIVRDDWTRFLHGWIVHIPALLVTIAILVIGTCKFYWYPEEGPLISNYRVDADTISNVLQLVAKLHELLIVASLSSIALAMFRRSLVTDGVRLGFLTGGYRVGDLAYLKSAAFWRQGLDISTPWGLLLPSFVVFATLMSTIVGPASAVLLVPTLDWYEIDNSIAFSKIELPLIYAWKRNNIWVPNRKKAPDNCGGVEGLYQDSCPAGGFPEISNWLRDFPATDLRNNLTFHSTSADLRRHLVFTLANSTQNTSLTTLCTTPPHFLTNSVGLFQKYIDHADVGALSKEPRYRLRTENKSAIKSQSQDNSTLYQPFVQSKCAVYDKEELAKDTSPLFYPVDSLNCFNDKECQLIQERGILYNKSWLPNQKLDNKSVASPFRFPTNSPIILIDGQIPDDSSGEPGHAFYLCNLLASWAPSNFTLDPRVDDALQSSLGNANVMRDLYQNRIPDDVRNLLFSKEWFEALNPTWDEGDYTNMTALWRLVQNFSSKERLDGKTQAALAFVERHDNVANYTAAEIILARVFGVWLTDGLARSTFEHQSTQLVLNKTEDRQLTYIKLNERYGVRGGIHTLTTLNSTFYRETWRGQTTDHNGTIAKFRQRLENFTHIHIVAERHGYGSGHERRTLQWAQAIMGIYLGIVVIYASWVGILTLVDILTSESSRSQPRILSIIPWSDLQDLVLLALRTPVPNDWGLADAGAGVSSSRV
ncbi:uncharacterized protein CTRU02_201297 [Colletotrichum truncatum]|uniref:Uncharacterized protein n=1 Tax=Colletotrichum truncatum TaxID=5467 RepID=A0ACC3ZH38_COLTU|nr:uncharacterized protein CTRU02_08086 [Colletotrichum truncatum]KAF6790566.1 hypothetical protein CTRU02_08086 [Colletotrichum truncatum]